MRDAVGHETPAGQRPDKRTPWKTPVVIVSEVQDTEFKGFDTGDYTSAGQPYGS
jgi:hypothetical protein